VRGTEKALAISKGNLLEHLRTLLRGLLGASLIGSGSRAELF